MQALDEKLKRLEQLEAVQAATASKPEHALPKKDEQTALAQAEAEAKSDEPKPKTQSGLTSGVSFGKNGFEFKTDDGKFVLAIQNRIQTRYANPFDSDPRSIDGSNDGLNRNQSSFMIRRARTKLRGHAYWPWLKYYLQYDWSQPVLRDLNLTVDKYQWAKLWFGRGKVLYNDERVTSSGNQQFNPCPFVT